MVTVKYVGPFGAVEIETAPRRWRTVAAGEEIEVADALAASLLEQTDNWAEPQATPAKKAATKKENPS